MNKFSSSLTIKKAIDIISERKCLVCEKNLDAEFERRWRIPLCKDHRLSYLDEMQKSVRWLYKIDNDNGLYG